MCVCACVRACVRACRCVECTCMTNSIWTEMGQLNTMSVQVSTSSGTMLGKMHAQHLSAHPGWCSSSTQIGAFAPRVPSPTSFPRKARPASRAPQPSAALRALPHPLAPASTTLFPRRERAASRTPLSRTTSSTLTQRMRQMRWNRSTMLATQQPAAALRALPPPLASAPRYCFHEGQGQYQEHSYGDQLHQP